MRETVRIDNLEQLRAACRVRNGHWIWQGAVQASNARVVVAEGRMKGPRALAHLLGRQDECQPGQVWTMRCGAKHCLAPQHLQLANDMWHAQKIAKRAGRLKRGPACTPAVTLAAMRRRAPEWVRTWAIESQQNSRCTAHALGVSSGAVRNWRIAYSRGENLGLVTGMFAQLASPR